MLLQERREHEQAPDAVNDAGNAREQLDGDADRTPQPHRAQFGEKYCDEQADRNGDQHGDERRNDGAVDRRDGAEFFGDRIPGLFIEEAHAERAQRRQRPPDQRDDDTAEDDQNRDGGSTRHVTESGVTQSADAAELSPGPSARRRQFPNPATPRQPRAASRSVASGSPWAFRRWGGPLKRPEGRNTSRLLSAVDKERAPSRRPFRSVIMDQLVIANTGLPSASLISLVQYFSTSDTTFAGIGT